MLTKDFILVENLNESDISTILSNLANLYDDTGFTDGIELSKCCTSHWKFLITFQNTPDFDHFAFFVNYIHYPADIEISDIVVNGFYHIKENNSIKEFRPGEYLKLYVSNDDKDYDNVSIVNENNEGYLFDFGGKTKKLDFVQEKYHLPEIDKANYSLLKVISPSSRPSTTKPPGTHTKPWWKFW